MIKAKFAPVARATGISIAVLFAAHAGALAQSPSAPVKIKAAVPLTVLVQHAGLEAAVAAGTFKAEGLEVEIVRFRSWTEPVQAIAGDAAQFALGAASLVRAVAGQNAPVRQIAMVSSYYPYAFWVKKDSGIRTIADVRGKTIQTVRVGETLDNVWLQVMAKAGLKATDVKRVESFNGFGTLASGTADIANLSSAEVGKARQLGFVEILYYNKWRQENGLRFGDGANLGWGTSVKMLEQQPQVVRGFLRALASATDRLRKDKAFGISVLKGQPFQLEDSVVEEIYELHKNHWMVRMDLERGDLSFDVEMIEIAMERPKGSIDIKTVTAIEPARDALKSLNITF